MRTYAIILLCQDKRKQTICQNMNIDSLFFEFFTNVNYVK